MDLAANYWEEALRAAPRWATQHGDHRWDHLLEDLSREARDREARRLRALLEKATDEALRWQIGADLDLLEAGLDEWTLDPLDGPQVNLLDMPGYQPAETPDERRVLLERWSAIPSYLDEAARNLELAAAEGKVGTLDAGKKVLAQLDDLLATRTRDWTLYVGEGLEDAVRACVPAFVRYREAVKNVLSQARHEQVGLVHLKGGGELYRKLVRVHTSLDLDPYEIHRRGQEELERIHAEIAGLRVRDPGLPYAHRDEVLRDAERTLARALEAARAVFGRLPTIPCVVEPIPPHEEGYSIAGYYTAAPTDGSRPAEYRVNARPPRPRFTAQVLAFHEGVPGHHLQLGVAAELEGLPEFRKHAGPTAYLEGWGLYAERLADELGLYETERDRLGMLAFDLMRAARLVVDTGIHALGWSRSRALEVLRKNTLLEDDVETEVDRMIVGPAQALAYKIGQLELLDIRAKARLPLVEFHDRVLGSGALPFPLLRKQVLG